MANDNTLGAPTEGLGANVTFAFNGIPTPGQMDSGGSGGSVRTGVQGGNQRFATAGTGVHDQQDPTIGLLWKFGEALIRPKIQQMQTEHFVDGMQRAAQGEAIQDIAASEPWYANIFGKADAVEGARQYYGNARVQETVGAMQDDMPNLRSMEPEAARKYFAESVTKNLTGDKAADAAIMLGIQKHLPSVMRQQSKEHYGWKQEQAATAESASFRAGAGSLQSAAAGLANGTVAQEDFDATVTGFLANTAPAYGRDPENYKKARTADLIGAAEAGQLHAVNALRSKGFMDILDATQRNHVESAVNSSEARIRTKYSEQWTDDMAKIEAQASAPLEGQKPQEVMAQAVALNDKFRKQSGSSIGIFNAEQIAAFGKSSALAIVHARNKGLDAAATKTAAAETAAAKVEQESLQYEQGMAVAEQGRLGDVYGSPGYSTEKVNAKVETAFFKKTPVEQVSFLSSNFLYDKTVVKPIADKKDASVMAAIGREDAQFGTGAQKVYGDWLSLHSTSPQLAAAYYKETGPQMMKFHQTMADLGGDKAAPEAFRAAFIWDKAGKPVDEKVTKEIIKEASSEFSDYTPAWMGGKKVRPEAAASFARFIGPTVGTWNATGIDTVSAVKQAIASKTGEYDMLGGHFIENPRGTVKLSTYLTRTGANGEVALGKDTLDDVVAQAIDERLRTHTERQTDGSYKEVPGVLPGVSAQNILVTRLPDRDGVPQLHVLATHDGQHYDALLSADSMFALFERSRAAKAAAKAAVATPFETPGNRTNDIIRPNLVGSNPRANVPQ